MPNWTRSIPADLNAQSLPLIRTPAAKPLRAIITSHELIGCMTHFYGGHTVPCDTPDCKPCNEGIPTRWHGYVACYSFSSQLHFILELTAAGAMPLQAYFTEHHTLRGCSIEAYRWAKRPNGRVVIKTETAATPPSVLPQPPDIQKIMAMIWNLPNQNVTVTQRQTIPWPVTTTTKGNGQSADPREYQHPNP
jgi:hypothetical protein